MAQEREPLGHCCIGQIDLGLREANTNRCHGRIAIQITKRAKVTFAIFIAHAAVQRYVFIESVTYARADVILEALAVFTQTAT